MKDWIISYIPDDKKYGYEYNKSDLKVLNYADLLEIRDAIEDIVIDIENELMVCEKDQ